MDKDSVVRKFRTTADDGKTYNVTYYNLDMIISLGYRIKSVNRKLLTGAGSVSHKQALEKAKSEYRKYQEITLTPVEKAYLEITSDEKTAEMLHIYKSFHFHAGRWLQS